MPIAAIDSPTLYATALKISYLAVIVPTALVVVSAILSAKEMRGTLGQGLKKIAAGSIVHTILLMTYLLLERGSQGILNDEQIRLFFMSGVLFASTLLVLGYLQIYKITKRLRLFT